MQKYHISYCKVRKQEKAHVHVYFLLKAPHKRALRVHVEKSDHNTTTMQKWHAKYTLLLHIHIHTQIKIKLFMYSYKYMFFFLYFYNAIT